MARRQIRGATGNDLGRILVQSPEFRQPVFRSNRASCRSGPCQAADCRWKMKCRPVESCLLCAGLGLAFSTAHPSGIVLSVCFPAIALSAPADPPAGCARDAITLAPRGRSCQPLGISSGRMSDCQRRLAGGSPHRRCCLCPGHGLGRASANHRWWHCLVAVLVSIVPSLGLIGWASPLTAAGYVFPGTSWFGILATLCGISGLSVTPRLDACRGC